MKGRSPGLCLKACGTGARTPVGGS
uniref:Uncharacterized protein n=1 Tax=Arundo donax TaxID=35708 RepID=A0A0A9CJJ3_ARUDO